MEKREKRERERVSERERERERERNTRAHVHIHDTCELASFHHSTYIPHTYTHHVSGCSRRVLAAVDGCGDIHASC